MGANFEKKFGFELEPILKKEWAFLSLRYKNASEENLHVEITICDFKTTYLLV